MAIIELRDVYVNGVDTQKRAQTLRQWFVKSGSLRSSAIPILCDINLSVREGDKLAILGRNGSGKSSLLKVISSIYPIASGYKKVEGTIAPLIEMGLGFDPELTGRRNIKLSFAYRGKLNMYSKELEEKIIDYSEIGEKIDLPFKSYSSGMQARISFASVIFQEPEILLLDEVLAVGDAGFVEKSKRTILAQFETASISVMVNHSLEAIKSLCNRFILMDGGRIIMEDSAEEITKKYHMDILKLPILPMKKTKVHARA